MRKRVKFWLIVGTVIVTAALAIAGLALSSSSTRQPRAVSQSAVPVEEALVSVGPDRSLDERWADLVRHHPGVDRPAADELHRYATGEFPYYRAACLGITGLGGFDVSGYRYVEVEASSAEEALEAYLCAARFPIVGGEASVRALSRSEVNRLHGEIKRYASCLAEMGANVAQVEDAEDFLRAWPSPKAPPIPDPGVNGPHAWAVFERTCNPPDPRE